MAKSEHLVGYKTHRREGVGECVLAMHMTIRGSFELHFDTVPVRRCAWADIAYVPACVCEQNAKELANLMLVRI